MNPVSWLFRSKYEGSQQETDTINLFGKREPIEQKQPKDIKNKKIKRYQPEEVHLDLPEKWKEKRANFTIYLDKLQYIRCHEEIIDKIPVLGRGGLLDNAVTLNQPAAGAKPIIEYLYTGKIELTDQNVEEIARVAHMWDVKDVLCKYDSFIKSQGHIDICLKLWKLDIPMLNECLMYFLLDNAQSLKKSPEFPFISLDHLFELLGDRTICIKSQYELLVLMMKWGKANCPDDQSVAEFLRSQTSANGQRLIDTIDFTSIHPTHMLDVMENKLLTEDEYQIYAKIVTQRIENSPSYKNRCGRYEKDYCNRDFLESLYYKTDWKPEDYNEHTKFESNIVRTFWKIDDVKQSIEKMRAGEVEVTSAFDFVGEYDHQYYLTCSITDDNYLHFCLESDDLLTTEDEEQEDLSLFLELRLINQNDRSRHITKRVRTTISDGDCPKNLAEGNLDFDLKIGEKLIPIDDLLNPKKGWVVNNEMILSAKIKIKKI